MGTYRDLFAWRGIGRWIGRTIGSRVGRSVVDGAVMSPNRFALNALNEEWRHVAASPGARRQLRSWSDRLPEGSPLGSLDDLALAIQRGQLDESTDLVWSLLGLAGSDQLARRVLLQAIVPGLMAEVRQLTAWALRTDVSLVDGGDRSSIRFQLSIISAGSTPTGAKPFNTSFTDRRSNLWPIGVAS